MASVAEGASVVAGATGAEGATGAGGAKYAGGAAGARDECILLRRNCALLQRIFVSFDNLSSIPLAPLAGVVC